MTRNSRTFESKTLKSKRRTVFLFSVTILILKALWLFSIPGKGLLGADGESYLSGVDALSTDGVLSRANVLHYWPAGYPLIIWPIRELFGTGDVFLVGIFQSVLFTVSIIMFSLELLHRKFKNLVVPLAILLNLSPTLSLNSVVIGYEVSVASMLLISITFLLRFLRSKTKSNFVWACFAMSIASFMQPRVILLAFGVLLVFVIYTFRTRQAFGYLAFSFIIIVAAPGLLAIRNLEANNFLAVSTNLGVAMNIGAGDEATGGYSNNSKGVSCEFAKDSNPAEKDAQLVKCVLTWYVENPDRATELFVNKFLNHWSPWFGPLSMGTSARNPWLNFSPLVDIAGSSEEGNRMIYGTTGEVISWIWVVGSLSLLLIGFRALIRRGGESTILAWMMFAPIVLNTFSSMGTIGDNRFRIPTLTLSIALQGFGVLAIFRSREFRESLDGPQPPLTALNWNSQSQNDNLRT